MCRVLPVHHSCLSVPDGPVGHRRVAKDRDTEVDPRCLLTHPRVLLLRLERLLPGLVPLYTGLAQVSIREVRSRQVHVAQVRAPQVRVAQVPCGYRTYQGEEGKLIA